MPYSTIARSFRQADTWPEALIKQAGLCRREETEEFEPLNNGHTSENPETDNTPRLRVWNTRREIIITESDLFYAANVE